MINEKYIHSDITAQAINYLEAFNLEVGLLLNFGSMSLQYKRVIHPKLLNQKIS